MSKIPTLVLLISHTLCLLFIDFVLFSKTHINHVMQLGCLTPSFHMNASQCRDFTAMNRAWGMFHFSILEIGDVGLLSPRPFSPWSWRRTETKCDWELSGFCALFFFLFPFPVST